MRVAPLVPLLALLALAGCLDHARGVAHVVLAEQSIEVEGPGRTRHFLASPCDVVRYTREPPVVEVLRPARDDMHEMRADFVIVVDRDEGWRAAVPNARGLRGDYALVAASGGGPLGLPLTGGGSGMMGVAPAFDARDVEPFLLAWGEGAPRLDGEALARGEPVERARSYSLDTEEGPLHVTETLRFTWLGKAKVAMRESEECSGVTAS